MNEIEIYKKKHIMFKYHGTLIVNNSDKRYVFHRISVKIIKQRRTYFKFHTMNFQRASSRFEYRVKHSQ